MMMLALIAGYAFIGWRWGLKAAAWAVGLGFLIPWLAYGAIMLWGWLDHGLQGPGSRWAVGAGLVMVGIAGSLSWLATGIIGSSIGLLIRRWTHKTPKVTPKTF